MSLFIIAYHLFLFLFHYHSSDNYNLNAVMINTKVPEDWNYSQDDKNLTLLVL